VHVVLVAVIPVLPQRSLREARNVDGRATLICIACDLNHMADNVLTTYNASVQAGDDAIRVAS
jgi:hypothetical protein